MVTGVQTCALPICEDEGLAQIALFENVAHGAALVVAVHAEKKLLDRGRRFVGAGRFNGDGLVQVAFGQPPDFRREGGRKQQRGAAFGQVAEDALQVGQKADVQHAIGLVQHHVFHLAEHGAFGFDVIEQAARRGHQHFNALFQLGGLRLHVHAAKDDGAAQVRVFGIQGDLLRHLVGQLARGQQHQRAHGVARGRGGGVFVLEQPLQQRQREGRRFARAGLSRAHHVLPGQHHGNGLRLDGGHVFVAHLGHGALERLGKRQC